MMDGDSAIRGDTGRRDRQAGFPGALDCPGYCSGGEWQALRHGRQAVEESGGNSRVFRATKSSLISALGRIQALITALGRIQV